MFGSIICLQQHLTRYSLGIADSRVP